MKVKKTIQGGIVNLTNIKEKLLDEEYERLQELLELERRGLDFLPLHDKIKSKLYSANAQQALRYYKKLKDKEYPISVRKDLIEIRKCDSDVCDYFVKVPVGGRRGGIKVPVNTHQDIKDDWEIGESKLFRRDDRFFVDIVVQAEVEEKKNYEGVLAFDLGIRNFAVSVELPSRDTQFRGKEIGEIRRKYFYLRRQTNYSQPIQKWSQRERNRVNDVLHKLTRKIVDYAEKHDLLIAIGDLEEIREQDMGRKGNRKLNSFPFDKFKRFIEYKAEWEGIKVVEVDEAYTSTICSRCGETGEKHKGNFTCPHCGLDVDRDKNGAHNIGVRALGKVSNSLFRAGAPVTVPESGVDDKILEAKLPNTWNEHSKTSGAGSGDKSLSDPETFKRLEAPSSRTK